MFLIKSFFLQQLNLFSIYIYLFIYLYLYIYIYIYIFIFICIYSFYSNELWINLYMLKPCFITWVESNDKQLKIKPCAWCIMHVPANWMGNWILIITWKWLFLICISTFFWFINAYFLLSIMNFFIKMRILYSCFESNLKL